MAMSRTVSAQTSNSGSFRGSPSSLLAQLTTAFALVAILGWLGLASDAESTVVDQAAQTPESFELATPVYDDVGFGNSLVNSSRPEIENGD